MFDAPTESVTTRLGVHEGVGKKSKLKLKWGGVGLYKVFYPLHSFCLKVGGGLILRDGLILSSLRYMGKYSRNTQTIFTKIYIYICIRQTVADHMYTGTRKQSKNVTLLTM